MEDGRDPGRNTPAIGPIERRRRARRGRWVRALLGLTLIALLGLGLRGLGSEGLVQALAERAVEAARGRLILERPSGSLLGTLRIERVVWHDQGLTLAVRRLEWSMGWYALLRGRVRVETLAAEHLDVLVEPSTEPMHRPHSLHVPLAFEVAEVRLQEGLLRETGSDAPLRLRQLRGGMRYDRAQWWVSGLSVQTPWGSVQADGRMQDRAPFALSAQGRWTQTEGAETRVVDLRARGDLDALVLEAETQQHGAQFQAEAQVRPFEPQPLARLQLNWAELDAARWHAHAPTTRLSGALSLEADPGQPAWSQRWPTWRGTVRVANDAPGLVEDGRLPIATLESRLDFDGQRLRLSAVRAEGRPGVVTGSAEVWGGQGQSWPQFDIRLATQALDLSQVVAGLPPTALRGALRARPAVGGVALGGQLSEGPVEVVASVLWTHEHVQLVQSRWSARQGHAELAGQIATQAPYRFDLTGRLLGLDPTQFGALPAAWGPGRLHGSVAAQGRLGAEPAVQAVVKLADSRWRDLPLRGQLVGAWQPGRLQDLDVNVRWGASELRAQGGLGLPGEHLELALELPRLAELPVGGVGRVSARARLTGSLDDPAMAWQLTGQALAARAGWSVQALALQGSLQRLSWFFGGRAGATRAAAPRNRSAAVGQTDAQPDADSTPLALSARLDGARWGGITLDRLDGAVRGDWLGHAVTLHAQAREPQWDFQLRAAGAWRDGAAGGWAGQIQEAVLTGALPARLLEPANVVWGGQGGAVMPLRLELDGADGARLDLEQARWQDGALRVLGTVQHVPLRWLRYAPRVASSGLRLDDPAALRLGARIDLSGLPGSASGLQGSLEVFRESGDLVLDMPTADGRLEPMAAGLQSALARVDVDSGLMRGVLALHGTAIGSVRADLKAPWVSRGGTPWPDWQVPLRGQVALDLPSLAFARALAGDAWRFAGALSAQWAVAGTLAAPTLNGQIRGERLLAEQRELGMRLSEGVLVASLRDNVLELESLRFVSGRGSVSLSGALRPDERSEAVLILDRLPMPLGAGQRLVVSGEARAALRGGQLTLRGALRADEGVIELTGRNAPRVSSDVVRVRDAAAAARHRDEVEALRRDTQAEPEAAGRESQAAARGFRIVSALSIDLGDAFRVFGSGLEARLTGRLTLSGQVPDAPRLQGTLRIAQGTYAGFGQKLEIERGALVFSGPVDNPAIDIVAYRRYLPVEAGVALSGTAQAPRLVLVSRPEVPEPDKLSWLVLGVGADQSRSGGQNAALQAAATTLLASADPSMTGPGLAKSFGLDVVSVRTGQVGGSGETGAAAASAQDSIVTLGKRLTQRVFVSYEQSLRGLQNLLRLQYEITERLSIRGRAGTQNGVDLLWTYRYD